MTLRQGVRSWGTLPYIVRQILIIFAQVPVSVASVDEGGAGNQFQRKYQRRLEDLWEFQPPAS